MESIVKGQEDGKENSLDTKRFGLNLIDFERLLEIEWKKKNLNL